MSYLIQCIPFKKLTLEQLYFILQLREQVFMKEQSCKEIEADGVDLSCHHLLFTKENKLIAYARLIPPTIKYEEASIGRVVIRSDFRGNGLGNEIMDRAILEIKNLFKTTVIKISAQTHLEKFYESKGFKSCSDIYDEGGISHIKMQKD